MGLRWRQISLWQLANILLSKSAWCERDEFSCCSSEYMKYVVLDFSAPFKGFLCKLGNMLPVNYSILPCSTKILLKVITFLLRF